ncbi:NAD(P)H-dependent oxidoreductase [Rhodobacteraceae bacterium NNCM2]|nr:NAD(P)H-dependent oxidoreductase [Coraliihabitans acroporae]
MKLLGISGSLRKGSFNTKLVHEAARVFEPSSFTFADLNLPLFNEDVEAEGIPAPVQVVCDQIVEADAIVISTTEYNKAPSGVLKNMLDWVSRPRPAPMVGKPVAVVSAAAGIAGGQRATSLMYLYLIPFKVELVTHQEVNIGNASEAFDEHGRLKSDAHIKALTRQMEALKAAI